MKLILKKLRWQNFLATGNQWTEVDLLSHKTTLLVGKNGSGKSTLLDALCFVLFNKPFRKINKPQLVNSITNKDCLVECEFEINKHQFLVRRGIKPNIFEIYRDDVLITEDPDNRDYQSAFEKYIIKINHQTFCQIVILGSAIFVPFLALKTPQRREVVEDIVNLTIFSDMNKILKTMITSDEKELLKKNTQKTILENKIELTKEHLEELQFSYNTSLAEKEEHIKKGREKMWVLEQDLQKIDEAICNLENEIDIKYSPLRQKSTDLNKLKTELRHKVTMVNKDILFLMNNDTCPTCKQSIVADFKDMAISEKKAHIQEVEAALVKLDKSFEIIGRKLDEVEKIETKLKGVEKQRHAVESELSHHNLDVIDTENEAVLLRDKASKIDFIKFEEIQLELQDVLKVITDMSENKAVMDYATVLLKDTGVKSRMIKSFMPVINQLIAKYLAELDFFVEFTLDEKFEEHIKSRYRDEFSYESFSEGEKMRLNLAVLFTWRAIARKRSSINVNLIIFDEVLDSSLDIAGISDILKLITTMTKDNILIISHREDQMMDKFNKVLRFEKSRNFSRMT